MKKLVIPSTLDEAVTALKTIVKEVQAAGYADAQTFAVRLALDEAISNAVVHGNDSEPAKRVTIEYQIDAEQVRVTVCDEGPGFNPDDVPDPTLDENLECPHGRGVMLMRAYMTHVSFNPRGNCVTLVKHRNCRLPLATG